MPTSDRPILLVEDNPDDEELTLMSLRDAGLTEDIHVAHDGVEALDWLRQRTPETMPVLVLLDLGLPRIDGFGVLTELRRDQVMRTLPVVILTSSSLEEDIARGYALGVNSYVRKPVEYDDFANSVRQLGLYWMLLNKSPNTHRKST